MGEKFLHGGQHIRPQAFEVRILRFADYLYSGRVEKVVKSGERKPRAVKLVRFNADGIHIFRRPNLLKVKFLYYF